MKIKNIICIILILSTVCSFAQDNASNFSVKMAESVMQRHPEVYDNWNYVTGTVLNGFEAVWRATGDERYYNYIKNTIDKLVDEDGTIKRYRVEEYNIDQVKTGSVLLFLYEQTGQEKYKKASQTIRSQLDGHPRINLGGFWHKQIYPWQMWLDGLYMGCPFYAQYSKMFNRPEDFDDIVKQFVLIDENLKDAESGLYYHAWDESKQMFWADKETGLSKCFWGRGLGWYAMAIVDVLDYIPKDHAGRDDLIKILSSLAETLTKYQDESGLWWQVMDQANREGNYLEGSASSMFVYSLAKALNMDYINEKYQKTMQRGYQGILKHLIYEDARGQINLLRICSGAGLGGDYIEKIRDGSYEYYVYIEPIIPNDGKGVGPFMMAGVEIGKLKSQGKIK